MGVKTIRIYQLDSIVNARLELVGGFFEIEVPAGPVAGGYVNKRLRFEQLAELLSGNATPNHSKSLRKAFRYLTRAEVAANGGFGEAFEDLDYATCCVQTQAQIEFYQPDPATPRVTNQVLVAIFDGSAPPAGYIYVDGSFKPGELVPARFVTIESNEAKYGYVRRDTSPASIADWHVGELSIWNINGADQFATAKQAGGPFPAFTGVEDAYWKPAAAPTQPSANLLASDNRWTGFNTYEQGLGFAEAGKPVSASLVRTTAFGQVGAAAVQVNDGRRNFYAEFQALDTYSVLAPQALNSHTKLAAALGQVSFVTGAKILWVQGGLSTYSPQRGNQLRLYASLQAAHDAASAGDLLVVLPGGTGTDAFGRVTYTENFLWAREVRILFAPGAIHAGLFQCNAFLGTVASRRELMGGEFLGRVIHWRQLNVANYLLVRNARFTGLGSFEINGTGTANDAVVATAVLRNCEFDSKATSGSQAGVRVIGRDDMGPVVLELDNTLVMSSTDVACVTMKANAASRLILRGTTELRGQTLYDNRPTDPGNVLVPQSQWLVDARPAGGGGGTGSLVTGIYPAENGGPQTITPGLLPGLDKATQIVSIGVRSAGANGDPMLDLLPQQTDAQPPVQVWSFDASAHTLSITAAAGIDQGDVLEIVYVTGSISGATPAPAAVVAVDYTTELIYTAATTLTAAAAYKSHVFSGNTAFALTLPAASTCTGKLLAVRVRSTALAVFTVAAQGSDTINGDASFPIWTQESLTLLSTGTGWTKVSSRLRGMSADIALEVGANVTIGPDQYQYNYRLPLTRELTPPTPGMHLAGTGIVKIMRSARYLVAVRGRGDFAAAGNFKIEPIIFRNQAGSQDFLSPPGTTDGATVAILAGSMTMQLNAGDEVAFAIYCGNNSATIWSDATRVPQHVAALLITEIL